MNANIRNSRAIATVVMLMLGTPVTPAAAATSTDSIGSFKIAADLSRRSSQELAVKQAANVIAVVSATLDPDGDGFPEAPVFVTGAGPAGGGLVPANIGAATSDGYGGLLGYCVWDNGSVVTTGVNRVAGSATNLAAPSFAVVSAGLDGVFNRTCAQIAAGTVTTDDDFVVAVSTSQIKQGVGGTVYFGDPVATITALNALNTAATKDGELRLVKADNTLWRWNSATTTWAAAANTASLSSISAATTANLIDNAANAQRWNWQLSGAGTGFAIGETAASTGGSGTQYLHTIGTLAGSSAIALSVAVRGVEAFRVDSVNPQIVANAGSVTAPSYAFAGAQGTGMYLPAANSIGFATAGAARLTIDASGNVGIGTTSPGVALDVVGTIRSATTAYPNFQYNANNRMAFGETNPPVNETGSVVSFGSGSTSRNMLLALGKIPGSTSFLGNDGTQTMLGSEGTAPITFRTGLNYSATNIMASGAEVMRIASNGNLLIGSATDDASGNKLQVTGGIKSTGSLTVGGSITSNADIIVANSGTTTPLNQIYFGPVAGEGTDVISLGRFNTSANNSVLQMTLGDDPSSAVGGNGDRFQIATNESATPNVRHYFDSNGNAYHAGDLAVNGKIVQPGRNEYAMLRNLCSGCGAVDIGNFYAPGSSGNNNSYGGLMLRMTITSSDYYNIGARTYLIPIGNNSTNGAWQIVGAQTRWNLWGNNDYELDINTSGANTSLRLRWTGGGNASYKRVQMEVVGDNYTFTESNATSAPAAPTAYYGRTAIVTNGGNVGMGTFAPQNRLDITNNTRSGSHATGRPLYVTGDVNAYDSGVEFRHSDGTQGIGFGFNGIYAAGSNTDQDLGLVAKGTGGVYFRTNGAERMRLDAAGNLATGGSIGLNNGKGIYLTGLNDSNWGMYRSASGGGNSLAGGTAAASLDGRTGFMLRMRAFNSPIEGFLWENSSEQALMSLAGDTGNLYTKGNINSGGTGTFAGAVTAASFSGNGASMTNLNGSNITSGTVGAAYGGTGLNGSAAGNGTLLIGNGTGYTLANLTAGTGIGITNGAGSITLANTGVTTFNTRTGAVVLTKADVDGVTSFGTANVTLGPSSLSTASSGVGNTAVGSISLASNTSGSNNSGFGNYALANTTVGFYNSAFGYASLNRNVSGVSNNSFGYASLYSNVSGGNNNAMGTNSLYYNTGSNNTGLGDFALSNNTTGAANVALGRYAGYSTSAGAVGNANTTGSNNTFLGASAMPGTTTQLNYATALGSDALVNTSNTIVLGRTTDNTVIGATGDDASGNKLQVTGGIKGTGNLTIGGTGTFTGAVSAASFNGNGSGVTNLNGSNINSGTVGVAYGGTGLNGSAAANGTLLIGNGTGYTLANMTAGTGISVTNGAGSITLANTGVTSFNSRAGAVTLSKADVDAATSFGSFNTTFGLSSLPTSSTSIYSTAFGNSTLASNTSGCCNAGFGAFALNANTSGQGNTAVGIVALASNITGSHNTAIGRNAGHLTATGSNTNANISGNNNTFLGAHTLPGTTTQLNYATVIGSEATITTSNTVVLGRPGDNTVIGAAGDDASGNKLQVTGGIKSLRTTSGSGLFLQNTQGGGGAYVDVSVTTYTGATNGNPATIRFIDDASNSNHITFRTKIPGGGANADAERLRIDSSGRLLVGLSADNGSGSLLQVNGNVTASTFTGTFVADDSTSISGSRPAKGVYVWTDKTFGMELQNQNSTWNTTFMTRAADGGFNFKKSDGTQLLYIANSGSAAFTGAVSAASFNGNGSGVTNLNGSNITSGTVGAAYGGTGLNGSAAANGSLLIGNGTGYTLANLTAGTGIGITNGAGSITLANTGVTTFNTRTGAVVLTKADVDGVTSFGASNVTLGPNSLSTASSGSNNTAVGRGSLLSNTSGASNSGFGAYALLTTTVGNYNNAFGPYGLYSNGSGSFNNAVGYASLYYNGSGSSNNALGNLSLFNNTGNYNTGLGEYALSNNTSGAANVALGRYAGYSTSAGAAGNANTTGSNNTFLGASAMPGTTTQLNYATALGSDALVNTSNTIVLGRTTDKTVIGATGTSVTGNTNGATLQVTGTIGVTGSVTASSYVTSSDLRLKEHIVALDRLDILQRLKALNGYRYNLISDPNKTATYGVIAQEILTLFPDTVRTRADGFYAVDYGALSALAAAGVGQLATKVDDFGLPAGGNKAINGALLIGNGNGFTLGTLTADTGISIVNTAGNITIKNNGVTGFNGRKGDVTLSLADVNGVADFGAGNFTLGADALAASATGSFNTAVGQAALGANTVGSGNTAQGYRALAGNVGGANNVGFGRAAGFANSAGAAVNANVSGSNNTFLGAFALPGTTAQLNYATAIGSESTVTTSDTIVLGRANDVTVLGASGDDHSGSRLQVTGNIKATGQLLAQSLTLTSAPKQGVWIGNGAAAGSGNGLVQAGDSTMLFSKGSIDGAAGMVIGPWTGASSGLRIATSGVSIGGALTVNGAITASTGYATVADTRFQKNIDPIKDAIAVITKLDGVRYEFDRGRFPDRGFEGGRQLGLIAQQIEPILPELVRTDAEGYKSVQYAQIAPLLVEGIKAQQLILKHLVKKDPSTLMVDIKTFQANDAIFESIKVATIKTATLEAETARIKKLEADRIESKFVRSDVVKSGEAEVFVSAGTFQPIFAPQPDSQYIVNVTAEDGSSAFASVAFMSGKISVTPISGKGVDVSAMGAQVGLVAASKKVKATWIRMS